jgi:histidinol-phosphate aminotransferase
MPDWPVSRRQFFSLYLNEFINPAASRNRGRANGKTTMPESRLSRAPVAPASENAPQPLARMQTFAPYQQGKSVIPGRGQAIKLSSNESCFGPGEAAVKAYREAAAQLHRYPDGSQHALRHAIAQVHGIDPDRIVCGNGSEEVIGLLIRCYLGEDDELLMPENHFVMCSIYGKGQGAKIVLAPETNFTVDVDALLERITARTKLITLANPNNPTGTYLPRAEIRRLLDKVPKDILVLLDGAYAEYCDRDDYDDGLRWVEAAGNLVVTHTFSKIYGLAGLRIGWAYGPASVIEIINRLRTPFNVNGPAMAAAVAAINDREHVTRSREHNALWQAKLSEQLGKLGIHVVPSVTNFYLLDFGALPGRSATAAGAFLEQHGIIPRPGGGDKYLRITIGNDAENQAVIESLAAYLAS